MWERIVEIMEALGYYYDDDLSVPSEEFFLFNTDDWYEEFESLDELFRFLRSYDWDEVDNDIYIMYREVVVVYDI